MTKKTIVVWLCLRTKKPWLSFGKDHNLGWNYYVLSSSRKQYIGYKDLQYMRTHTSQSLLLFSLFWNMMFCIKSHTLLSFHQTPRLAHAHGIIYTMFIFFFDLSRFWLWLCCSELWSTAESERKPRTRWVFGPAAGCYNTNLQEAPITAALNWNETRHQTSLHCSWVAPFLKAFEKTQRPDSVL